MSGWLKRSSRSHEVPDSDTLDSLRYVVLDTELTSLEHRTNRLLSIGAIAMQGASILLGEQFYRVVNPQCAIPAEGVVIHQLRADDVQVGADLTQTLDEFSRFVAGAVLVGHFTHIDIRILRKEMTQTGHAINNPAIDTARVHHWLLRQSPYTEDLPRKLEKLDLATMAESCGVKIQTVHHALADAFLTAQLWQKLQHALQANSINTLKKLWKIASV